MVTRHRSANISFELSDWMKCPLEFHLNSAGGYVIPRLTVDNLYSVLGIPSYPYFIPTYL